MPIAPALGVRDEEVIAGLCWLSEAMISSRFTEILHVRGIKQKVIREDM